MSKNQCNDVSTSNYLSNKHAKGGICVERPEFQFYKYLPDSMWAWQKELQVFFSFLSHLSFFSASIIYPMSLTDSTAFKKGIC